MKIMKNLGQDDFRFKLRDYLNNVENNLYDILIDFGINCESIQFDSSWHDPSLIKITIFYYDGGMKSISTDFLKFVEDENYKNDNEIYNNVICIKTENEYDFAYEIIESLFN